MRKIIAAQVISLDGFIEGSQGELDWVNSWEDPFDLLPEIDTCILGRGCIPATSSTRAHPGQPQGHLALHRQGCDERRD